ncbi:MAG: radical SAM protein [Butyrivibrio sp.]|nr:radical SAM protein [Butyrivibrio sp.]
MEKYTPYSELKIFHHTERIDGFLKGKRVAPIYVRIKPTNICNQRCFYCAYADDSLFDGRTVDTRESIPWDVMKETLCDFGEIGVKAITFSGGGEPLCYHSIIETLELVQNMKMDYSMITNGQALEGEAVRYLKDAKWIRISFDSANPETYKGIRRVSTHEKVLSNIADFANIKSNSCTLGINCVISKSNAEEVYKICSLVKELGVNNIKLSPIAVKEDGKGYHDSIKKIVTEQIISAQKELENESFRIVDKYTCDLDLPVVYHKEYAKCYIQNFFAVIAADSKVYRCHQRAYTKAGELGDLTQMSFKDIWFSQDTIDKMNVFEPQKECCFRCAFDERNMLLNDLVSIDHNHINFI